MAEAAPWRAISHVNPKIVLRLPFAAVGVLLGASLWIIAFCWYGGAGATLALALYCFSPPVVVAGSSVTPDLLATWGFYGAVFLAVATAHALYAMPGSLGWWREWRNPLLFALALAAGTAAQFWCVLALPFAFSYAIYLAPERRREAALKLAAGCLGAAALFAAACGFRPGQIAHVLASARFASFSLPFGNLHGGGAWWLPGAAIPFAIACCGWLASRRMRHFSNTAPLLPAVALMFLIPTTETANPFRPWAQVWPFAAMFVGGVFADLMQGRYGRQWRAAAGAMSLAAAVLSLATIHNI